MKVKFCPKCRSTEIELSTGGLTGMWECRKCGFTGTLFPEKEINENQPAKPRKK
jgi:ribosomal protein L37AE/L43A